MGIFLVAVICLIWKGLLFYAVLSKKDYYHVREKGPWIILGYYLTVSKWHPNFRPSTEAITSTCVDTSLGDAGGILS